MFIKTSKYVYFQTSLKADLFNLMRWIGVHIKHRCRACGNIHVWNNLEFIICEPCGYKKWNHHA
jgi:hypothetical protein